MVKLTMKWTVTYVMEQEWGEVRILLLFTEPIAFYREIPVDFKMFLFGEMKGDVQNHSPDFQFFTLQW